MAIGAPACCATRSTANETGGGTPAWPATAGYRIARIGRHVTYQGAQYCARW